MPPKERKASSAESDSARNTEDFSSVRESVGMFKRSEESAAPLKRELEERTPRISGLKRQLEEIFIQCFVSQIGEKDSRFDERVFDFSRLLVCAKDAISPGFFIKEYYERDKKGAFSPRSFGYFPNKHSKSYIEARKKILEEITWNSSYAKPELWVAVRLTLEDFCKKYLVSISQETDSVRGEIAGMIVFQMSEIRERLLRSIFPSIQ